MIEVPKDGKLLLYGPALINVVSTPLFGDDFFAVPKLREYMTEIMRKYKGAGLAAPQVGVFKEYLIYDNGIGGVAEIINPTIVGMYGKEASHSEGCLSLPPPNNMCLVPRMETIIVEHQPASGGFPMQTTTFHAEQAAVVQHEMDHLSGTFFIDRISLGLRKQVLDQFHRWKKEIRQNDKKGNPRQLAAHF
jgi:peptide deformylase